MLYPTYSYVNKKEVPDCYREEFKSFVNDNLLPIREGDETLVKFFAEVECVKEKSISRIGIFNKFHMWTRDHVASYLKNKKSYVWLLRVYELDNPIMLKRSNGMTWATVNESVELKGEPVISDKEFESIYNSI